MVDLTQQQGAQQQHNSIHDVMACDIAANQGSGGLLTKAARSRVCRALQDVLLL